MEELLKINFPNYKIFDASNKLLIEIIKIEQLCLNIPQLIMFVKRNENNKEYFKIYENDSGVNDIKWLFFNNDNYFHFQGRNKENLKMIVLSVKKFIKDDTECCICYEKINPQEKYSFLTCLNCSVFVCCNCISKYLKLNNKEIECPICRKVLIC